MEIEAGTARDAKSARAASRREERGEKRELGRRHAQKTNRVSQRVRGGITKYLVSLLTSKLVW